MAPSFPGPSIICGCSNLTSKQMPELHVYTKFLTLKYPAGIHIVRQRTHMLIRRFKKIFLSQQYFFDEFSGITIEKND